MTLLAYYMLKMVLCSGILFCYYHVALRNKVFHQYNRFYLLFAVVLSLILPLIQFELLFEGNDAAPLLESVQAADDSLAAIVVQRSTTSWESMVSVAYALICCALLLSFSASLYRIVRLIQTHAAQTLHDIRLVPTKARGTPFSFLHYIFWNDQISLSSETGQQIFQHELAHVREKHTLDKLFIQVVLILFWCNPFFWLIRKELGSLHEFIADKKAIANQDAAAFAAMILQAAYAQQFSSLTNPFFESSIKRRMYMLTKIQNPRVAYAARIAVLPLFALTIVAFTVRTKKTVEEPAKPSMMILPSIPAAMQSAYVRDTVPRKAEDINSVRVIKDTAKKISQLTINYKDGTSETLTEEQARAKGLLKSPQRGNVVTVIGHLNKPDTTSKLPGNQLLILDGKEIPNSEMNSINPNSIQSISVLKGESATSVYGERAKDGVIIITTKSPSEIRSDSSKVDKNKEIVVVGYARPKGSSNEINGDSQATFEKTETPASIDQEEWRAFLLKNLRPLIETAEKKGAKAGSYTTNLRFIVRTDGSVSNVVALNDPGYGLAKDMIEVMSRSPRWNPAVQNGQKVNAYHTQPITFVVQPQ